MRRKYILITIILSFMALAPGCAIGDKFYDVVASEDCLTFNSEASSSIVKIYEVPFSLCLEEITEDGIIVSTFEYENAGWRLDEESGTYKYYRHPTTKNMSSSWCMVTLGKLSKGVQPVTISVTENNSGKIRKCTVVVGSNGGVINECSIEVVQEAKHRSYYPQYSR